MNMIINYLKVYTPPSPKVRYGNNRDGGYVGVKIKTDILLSGGIGGNVSFELDFVKANDTNAVCVDSLFNNKRAFTDMEDFLNRNKFKNDPYFSKLQFINKLVGKEENDEFTNYSNFIEEFNDIALKLDIEGAEFDYINSLSNKQLNKINQIFLEVHWLDKLNDFSFFEKLNQNHILIHAHGNNCGRRDESFKVFKVGESRIPKVLEITYLHKKFFSGEYKLNNEPLPSPLDFPNKKDKADLSLNFPPFVNK
jgi:hypothetical protein